MAEEPALADLSFVALALEIERRFPELPPIGNTRAPALERFRFRANPSLGFPPGEIADIVSPAADARFTDIIVNHLGLFGPSSPLPAHITERIIHGEGGALADFLDFFNHRLTSLLFVIWKRYRYAFRYEEGGSDGISNIAIALFGFHDVHAHDDLPPVPTLLALTGLLSLGSRSAAIIEGIVTAAAGIGCRIEEFVPREFTLSPEDQFRLGAPGVMLGETTIAGETALSVAGHFIIRLGPLDHARFMSLLPGTEGYRHIDKLLRMTVSAPLSWAIELCLAPGEAPGLVLGEAAMGWTSWLDPPADQAATVSLNPS